jgi:cysteine desulfurase/selenocysteine lyase
LCQEHGARLRLIELDGDGCWDLARAEREGLYGPCTRIISLSLVSNVLGLRNPVEEVTDQAHARGIAVAIDAAQAVAHMPLDVLALDCDFLAFSGHKMYGPDGIGVLYITPERLQEMEPLLLGGGMVDLVEEHWSTWAPVPARLEAGSPNLAGAIGLAAAVGYLDVLDRTRVCEHLRQLAMDARAALRKYPGVRVYATSAAELQTGIVAFDVAGIHPHDVAQVACEHGVALRAGHHCCQPLMHALGVPALVRASFGIYNDRSDVDALATAVGAAQRLLGGSP